MIALVGEEAAQGVRLRTLALYNYASQYAWQRGIIIADTKFEFGIVDGEPIVIDEMLTPDSSRFWPADQYRTGRLAGQLRQAVRARLAAPVRLEPRAAAAGATDAVQLLGARSYQRHREHAESR